MIAQGIVLHDYFAQRDGGGKVAITLAHDLGWPVVAGSVSPAAGLDEDWPDVPVRVLGGTLTRPLPRIVLQAWRWSRYTGRHETAIYKRLALPVGARIPGPAILEQPDTTVLIEPGLTGVIDDLGNTIIERSGA